MRRLERIINGITISMLEIMVYDEEDIEELKGYRNETNLTLGMDMLPYLRYFEKADYLELTGGELGPDEYEPVYRVNPRALVVNYDNTHIKDKKIDLAKCKRLEYLNVYLQLNCTNYAKCSSLKTLFASYWHDCDLSALGDSQIDSLQIFRGKLISLAGIERMKQLKVLVLDSLRNLRDISALKECQELRKLRIEYCGKVDLWNLPESDSLRYLSIQGSKRISSLNDLKSLPKLEELLLEGCYVEDGNMECLKRIQNAVLFENRRHYSAKDADLPKRKMPHLLEDIPRWRQLFP